jgi:hypothetical protein
MNASRPVEIVSIFPAIDKGSPGPQEVQNSGPKMKHSDSNKKAEAARKQKKKYDQRKRISNKVVAQQVKNLIKQQVKEQGYHFRISD